MIITGDVVRDDRYAHEYRNFASFTTPALRFHPHPETSLDRLVTFTVDDLVIASGFVPIDVSRYRMFIHQSYSRIETLYPMRFAVVGDTFSYAASEPVRHAGRVAILGGSVDNNWYHWLLNWCLRMLVFRRLRPDLFDDPGVRFVVDQSVVRQPFRAILDTFGLPESRLLPVDRTVDHRFEEATVASFCDDHKLYPDLIREMSANLIAGLGVVPGPGGRRLFASRQGLPAPKRRIHNFADLEPVMRAHGFEVLELGGFSARDQAQTFHDAELVMGAHGSDLTNILFCRPNTLVLVIENRANVMRGLHLALKYLAEILGLRYELVLAPSAPVPAHLNLNRLAFFHADYVVDPTALDARVSGLLAGQRERWAAGPDGAAGPRDDAGPPSTFEGVYSDAMMSFDDEVDWVSTLELPGGAHRDGSAICSAVRTAGFFVDGPHEILEPGDYRLRIVIGLDRGDPQPVGFDVVCEAVLGNRILDAKGMRLTVRQEEHVLELRIPPGRAAEGRIDLFKLRLRTLKPAAVRLTSLGVKRLQASPPHSDEVRQGFIMSHEHEVDWLPVLGVPEPGVSGELSTASEHRAAGRPAGASRAGDGRSPAASGPDMPDLPAVGSNLICEAFLGDDMAGAEGPMPASRPEEHLLVLRVPAGADARVDPAKRDLHTIDSAAKPSAAPGARRPMDGLGTGHRSGTGIHSDDRAAGYFVDGPNETLQAGDYRLRIVLGLDGDQLQPAGCGVICEAVLGDRMIGYTGLNVTAQQQEHILVLRVPPASGGRDLDLFQLRLRTLDPAAVRVTTVGIRRLPAPPFQSDDIHQGFITSFEAADWLPCMDVPARARRLGTDIYSDDRAAGYFVDGSSHSPQAGDYCLRLVLGLDRGDPRPGGFDVVCEAMLDGRLIGAKGLRLTKGQAVHEMVLRIPPSADASGGVEQFKLRLRTLDPAAVRLSMLGVQRLSAPSEDGDGVRQGFIVSPEEADWLSGLEASGSAHRSGTAIHSGDREAGYFVDGPNESLQAGDYQVRIVLGLDGGHAGPVAAGVICEAVLGDHMIGYTGLTATARQREHVLTLRVPPGASPGDAFDLFQLRLRTLEPVAVCVTALGVRRLPAPPAHGDGIDQGFIAAFDETDWLPCMDVPATARRSGTDICSGDETAGYFVDGSAENLQAGDYSLRLVLGYDRGDPRPAGFDVVCEAVSDGRLIGAKGLKGTSRQDEHLLVLRVPRVGDAGTRRFKLRLRTLRPAAVRITALGVTRLPARSALGDGVPRGFITAPDEADWLPCMETSGSARRSETGICTDGTMAGYFVDGPHESLAAGDYRLRITLGLDGGTPRPVGFDVICEAALGDRIIGSKGLTLTPRQQEQVFILRLPPGSGPEADIDLFKLRLRTLDPAAVRISALTMQRLPVQPDDGDIVRQGFVTPFDEADWLSCVEVHEMGYRSGADICSRDGKAGYFVDGTHEVLAAGDYRFRITMGLPAEGGSGPIEEDVVCEANLGARLLASQLVKVRGTQTEYAFDARIPDPGTEGGVWFALRLRTVTPTVVRVTKLTATYRPPGHRPAGPDGHGFEKAVFSRDISGEAGTMRDVARTDRSTWAGRLRTWMSLGRP